MLVPNAGRAVGGLGLPQKQILKKARSDNALPQLPVNWNMEEQS